LSLTLVRKTGSGPINRSDLIENMLDGL
jgi:hypothetical protein